MSTPKLANFHHFFGFQEFEKKYVNTKTSQFFPFFGFQEFEKKHVHTKTRQFSPFLDSRSWEKTYIYIIYIYLCTYVYNMILLYLEGSGSKFHSVNIKTSPFFLFFWSPGVGKKHVNTKIVNFPHFLDSRSWEKNMSIPKFVNFPHFWIPGIEKKYVYI